MLDRNKEIYKAYKKGLTLEKVGEKFGITRERVRQIIYELVEKDLLDELGAKKFIFSGKDEKDKLKFVIKQRIKKIYQPRVLEKDLLIKKDIEKTMSEIPHYSTFLGFSTYIKSLNSSNIVFERLFPSLSKKIKKYYKEKWSWDYKYCIRCKKTEYKHRSNGYCIKCYPKTKISKEQQTKSRIKHRDKRKEHVRIYSKEYNKRPESIKRRKEIAEKISHGGNRQDALKRDGFKCSKCGLTQKKSYEDTNKDLNVEHKDGNSKNNALSNLITICYACHNKKYLEAVNNRSREIRDNNSLKILEAIREYNIECNKGIDFKTLTLLLTGELSSQAIDKHIHRLLDNGNIKQKYGNYMVPDQDL